MLMILIPFRRSESWAKVGVPVIGLMGALPLLYTVIKVKFLIPASPPLSLAIIVNLLFIVGFLFSWDFRRTNVTKRQD
jgi:hypothetical protein